MLHCALVMNWQAVSYLELVVTQNLLLVGWILHISEQDWAGVDKAADPAECAAAGRGKCQTQRPTPVVHCSSHNARNTWSDLHE